MSHHGCPERLSNMYKGFSEEGNSQATMEVLVETLTGTAFEMTVSPSDTIFEIKSKIFRVEGIPVAQQHLLYNLKELNDSSSLHDNAISDGAKLRLVLGMRGGPISTRRLPPPPNSESWRDIERLLDSNHEDGDWSGGGSGKVTLLVFRDGERVNMLRLRENRPTHSPLAQSKYSTSLTHLVESPPEEGASGSLRENVVTMHKMLRLRQRMHSLSLQRRGSVLRSDTTNIPKTRSEEYLSVPSLLDDPIDESYSTRMYQTYEEISNAPYDVQMYTPYSEAEDSFTYDGNYTRYDYDCPCPDRYTLLPPIGSRSDSDQSVQEAVAESERLTGSILMKNGRNDDEAAIIEECLEGASLEECHLRQSSPQLAAKNLTPITAAEYGGVSGGSVGWRAWGFGSSSALCSGPSSSAPLSSSAQDLRSVKLTTLPAGHSTLQRHRNSERLHLHLSDDCLDCTRPRLAVGSERRARRIERINELDTRQRAVNTKAQQPTTSNNNEQHTKLRAPQANTNTINAHTARLEDRQPTSAGAPIQCEDIDEGHHKTSVQKKPTKVRCCFCRKRLSIATVHKCRCGSEFCAPHRYAEVHGCAYDYKANAHEYLERANPHITAPKLPKI